MSIYAARGAIVRKFGHVQSANPRKVWQCSRTFSDAQATYSRNTASSPLVRPRRALLYMPGNNARMVAKAARLSVDTICMDLEDAVTVDKKILARQSIVSSLESVDFGLSEVMFRINPVASGFGEGDLKAVLRSKVLPHGIVIPKVEDASQLEFVDSVISDITGAKGDNIKLLALVESAKAVVRLQEISAAVPHRLEGLIFGADDYAADIGALRSASNSEVSFARNLTLLHAKAAGLQAIDLVNIRFKEPDQLETESREGFHLGFTGKQIIHPSQIEPVQRCFSPSDDVVSRAKRILEAYEHHLEIGKGAFTLDGEMIDMPSIKNAQGIIARAQ
eukprot:260177_1